MKYKISATRKDTGVVEEHPCRTLHHALYIATSMESTGHYKTLRVSEVDDLKIATDILAWLAQIEGTVSIHEGVATAEDGMAVDLNQWRGEPELQ